LKSGCFHRGEFSSYILLSYVERTIFVLLVGYIPLDPSLTQSLEDSQAFIYLFPISLTLNAVNHCNHFQTVTNGKQWEISDGRDKYRTTATKMAKQSTTGFSLQCQSAINHTSDENYGNDQLQDIVFTYQPIRRALMSKEMKDSRIEFI